MSMATQLRFNLNVAPDQSKLATHFQTTPSPITIQRLPTDSAHSHTPPVTFSTSSSSMANSYGFAPTSIPPERLALAVKLARRDLQSGLMSCHHHPSCPHPSHPHSHSITSGQRAPGAPTSPTPPHHLPSSVNPQSGHFSVSADTREDSHHSFHPPPSSSTLHSSTPHPSLVGRPAITVPGDGRPAKDNNGVRGASEGVRGDSVRGEGVRGDGVRSEDEGEIARLKRELVRQVQKLRDLVWRRQEMEQGDWVVATSRPSLSLMCMSMVMCTRWGHMLGSHDPVSAVESC